MKDEEIKSHKKKEDEINKSNIHTPCNIVKYDTAHIQNLL